MYSNRFTGTKTIITLPDKLYNNWDRFEDMWTESHSEIVNASQILRGDYKYFQCINGLDIDWGPFCSSSSYSQFYQDEANHPKVMQNSPGQSVYWCLIKSALAIMTKTKNPTFHPLDCETFYTLSVWALPPPHWGKHQAGRSNIKQRPTGFLWDFPLQSYFHLIDGTWNNRTSKRSPFHVSRCFQYGVQWSRPSQPTDDK